jgi:heme/copper-type cytochrome/quinol oxidase subunit 4
VYEDLPLNHRLRHVYRGLAGLIGLAMLAFGAAGLGGHSSVPGFAANLALAVVALLLGLALVVASVWWREVSHVIYLAVGGSLLVVGLAMLLLLRTADFFGANMTSCLAVLIAGLAVFVAGTYTRTGTAEDARDHELRRHGSAIPTFVPGRPRGASPDRRAAQVPRLASAAAGPPAEAARQSAAASARQPTDASTRQPAKGTRRQPGKGSARRPASAKPRPPASPR